ncbi:MAG: endonuclease VII domain-containing protein [Nanoarchaeota archaeon]
MKRCCKCKVQQPIKNFYKDKSRGDSLQPRCKSCKAKIQREYRQCDPEKNREQARKWYKNNKETYLPKLRTQRKQNPKGVNMANKKWRSNNQERRKAYYLAYYYKITTEEYNQLLKSQNGICAFPSCRRIILHVDHDHKTGKVRGLLCTQHNVGLGSFKDNIQQLAEGIEYLQKYEDTSELTEEEK